jgi:hypothetical protein
VRYVELTVNSSFTDVFAESLSFGPGPAPG